MPREEAIAGVLAISASHPRKDLPREENVVEVVLGLEPLLFPEYKGLGYFGEENGTAVNELANKTYDIMHNEILKAMRYVGANGQAEKKAREITERLFSKLPTIRGALQLDIEAAYQGDPAATSHDDVIVYPGFQAIVAHRIAHELYLRGVPFVPRVINEYAHGKTGIDINPGAKIGDSFFIDHGTGTVIGETAIIGERVTIYQGVTLGALTLDDVSSLRGAKRHPTIEDDVTIYANATILGGGTVIGKGSVIGGGVWLTDSVSPNTKVTQSKPELKYKPNGGR